MTKVYDLKFAKFQKKVFLRCLYKVSHQILWPNFRLGINRIRKETYVTEQKGIWICNKSISEKRKLPYYRRREDNKFEVFGS